MAISYPSNISYRGTLPNFTRDSFATITDMNKALADNEIDIGHLSYCEADGATYKAVWEDLEDHDKGKKWIKLEDDLDISAKMTGISEEVERELTGIKDDIKKLKNEFYDSLNPETNPQGTPDLYTGTRLDKLWDWYDMMTHVPAFNSSIKKTSNGNLRIGTSHTYQATFEWDYASREGVTGVKVYDGTSWSDLEEIEGAADAGQTHTKDISITINDSTVKTLKASFWKTGLTEYTEAGQSELKITPLNPSRTFVSSGLPTSWKTYDSKTSDTMTIKAIGSNLPVDAKNEFIRYDGTKIGSSVPEVTDADWTLTNTHTVKPTENIKTYTYTWVNSTDTENLVNSQFTPSPSFVWISSNKNAWDGASSGISGIPGMKARYYLYQTQTGTTTPEYTFTAGSTLIYLSPNGNLGSLKVQSQASGSSAWTDLTSFDKSGTVTYLGKTYYYRMCGNIGAGVFKFRFTT